MAAKTLCHEIAHHYAEHIDTRQEHETIAESVAYIVLGHFGIDAGDYSFGYLASWSDLRDVQGEARRHSDDREPDHRPNRATRHPRQGGVRASERSNHDHQASTTEAPTPRRALD